MNTQTMARNIRLRHWAELLNARNASGKTVKAWCSEQGISVKTYYYRQNQLRREACSEIGANLTPRGFAEVKALRPPTTESFSMMAGQGEIRIEAAGVRITADATYPVANLAELIRGCVALC